MLNEKIEVDENGTVTNGDKLDRWIPIGNSIDNPYEGTFNGDGHTISGLYINNSTADYQGLFGYVGSSGEIEYLTVSGDINGNNYVGGVVGLNLGSVENCHNIGEVSGTGVGGVVGWNDSGTVKNCYNIGEVSGPDSVNGETIVNVGGVVGSNSFSASVTNCYNTGTFSGPDSGSGNSVGGVVGYNYHGASVENCYNTGSVSGGMYVGGVGGVVGYNYHGASVKNCYNTGTVTGPDSDSGSYVGGVVGLNSSGDSSASASVTNCYNTGTVTGPDSGSDSYVGGVVGSNSFSASVTNCYNTGTVSGPDNVNGETTVNVGGVVGQNFSASVTNCYNTGEVSGLDSGSDSNVGGVVGQNFGGTVENCYNIGEVSGNRYVGGVVGYNFSSGGSGNVTNCYNTGTVSGPYSGHSNQVGGVVGQNFGGTGDYVGGVVGYNSSIGNVKNCYNTGKVIGSSVGGVVGDNHSSGIVTDCYFLTGTAASGIGNGSGEEIGADATPVDDLDALYEKFESVTGWETNTTLNRPVLKDNHEDDGSEQHPYEIFTATQLKNFATAVNGGEESAHAKLMNNIDLKDVCGPELDAETSWIPIGNSEENAYTGTFNGDGHTISGLYIYTGDNDQGLFGCLDQGGTVKDLSVSGSVKGYSYVGGVVGYNNGGTVTGCIFSGSGSVSGSYSVGGVVGYNYHGASVENCYNTGEVSGGEGVGGVVGRNFGGTVENCYNTGSVSGPDSGTGNRDGGVVGYNSGSGGSGTVTGCYFLKTETVNTKLQGIGENDGSGNATATEKDDTAFHSGEVAWLLENGQTEDQTTPVWGQNLMNEPKDNYPQLRAFDADTPQVYKVAFMNDSEEHDAKYANSGMTVTIPAAPSREGHTLTGWQDADKNPVTGQTVTITSDTTYYAQWTKDTVNYTVTVTTSPAEGGTVNGGGTFAEDTQVTVTATANAGYTFVAWQENSTKIEGAGASYTFTVNDNCTLTAIFEKEPEPTPTPTPDPTPSGPSTGDSSGWDDICDELENAENGDEITIDMGDETKVPAEIFESLAGKDVDVTFDLGDIQWSVNGADIPTDTDFTDLDLGVNLDTHGIPVNVINTITGEVGTVQITLAHDGEFGFTMTLTAPLGKENAGYWANLYHYDEDAEALNFEAAAKIDEDGSVAIPFSHASQYAIVIDTHSHATVDVSDLFIDIARDAWYKDAVQYAYDNGLMTGVSATEFAPEATTTRAMIVSILARLEGVTTAQAAGFADVDDEWYATAVNWAANVGVVNGYEDNTFRPNTAITREQLAAILMNYAAYKGEDVSNRADLTSYTDQPSTWAEEAMSWAVAEGLISGVTADTLQPQGAATRAQVAAILHRFLSE